MSKKTEEMKKRELLNQIFNVNEFLKDSNMVDRYSEYLNKILIMASDKFIRAQYTRWKNFGKDVHK
jgi:hypothetical protein